MIKSELILRLAAANPHLYQRDVERIVSTIFQEVADALARGDRVEIRGFGAFSVKAGRPAPAATAHRRSGRSGREIRPFFKTGKELRERLNVDGDSDGEAEGDSDAPPRKSAKG